jgi:hypothetical protein
MFGFVIDYDPWLARAPRTEDAHDGFAVVLFAPDLPSATSMELLERIALNAVLDHLDHVWPFPMSVELPRDLTDGHLVYCTSILLVLRHTPLGQLRSRWIPLLIHPARTPYAMMLPMQYWPGHWRRQWKTIAESDQSHEANA